MERRGEEEKTNNQILLLMCFYENVGLKVNCQRRVFYEDVELKTNNQRLFLRTRASWRCRTKNKQQPIIIFSCVTQR